MIPGIGLILKVTTAFPQAIAFIFFNFLIIEFTSRRGKNLAYPFGIRRDMHIPFNHQDGIIGYLSTIIAF